MTNKQCIEEQRYGEAFEFYWDTLQMYRRIASQPRI